MKNCGKQISVVTTTYKALDYLKLCVRSLLKNADCENQIVIYADGSGPETLEYLRSLDGHPQIKYRYEKENVGITRATNRAAELADGHYLYFINDDMVFAPGYDSTLGQHMQSRRALTTTLIEPERPNIKVSSEHIKHNYGLRQEDFDMQKFNATVSTLGEDRVEPGVRFPLFLEREVFDEIGRLDERFSGAMMDPDLYYRLALAGIEMLRVRNSLSYHFSGRSVRFEGERITVTPRWIREETQGKIAFLRKWGEKAKFDSNGLPQPRASAPDQKRSPGKRLSIELQVLRYQVQSRRRLAKAEAALRAG